MKRDYENWEYDDFFVFLLIHAAMADFVIQDEEKDIILQLISKDEFKEFKKFHDRNNDYENIQVIMNTKERLGITKQDKDKIFDGIKTIFFADGEYNLNERIMNYAFELLFRA